MKKLFYRIFFKFFALTPWFVLRGLANCLYVLLYYVLRYRLKVVRANLSQCFPEFDAKKLRKTEKDFYLHLSDIITETLKGTGLSLKGIQTHLKLLPNAASQEMLETPQSLMILIGHCNNWEWFPLFFGPMFEQRNQEGIGFYKSMRDKVLEKMMLEYRIHLGGDMYPADQVLKVIKRLREPRKLVVGTAGDQRPNEGDRDNIIPFLNRETPFFGGPAWIAVQAKMPIYYGYTRKVSRNYYEVWFEKIYSPPEKIEDKKAEIKQILCLYAECLEKQIRSEPANWLWSHKRWKYA